jgi:uncharacterized membrane protein
MARLDGWQAALVGTGALFVLMWLRSYAFGSTLLWLLPNLALAWMPVLLAWGMTDRVRLVVLAPVWLLFLPNAPYLMSDVIHLEPLRSAPTWFDAVLLGCAGGLGALLGAISLVAVGRRLASWLGRPAAIALVAVVCPLAGLGIRLGRYERWHSWHVLTDPMGILRDAASCVTDPDKLLFVAVYAVLLGAATAIWALGQPLPEPVQAVQRQR